MLNLNKFHPFNVLSGFSKLRSSRKYQKTKQFEPSGETERNTLSLIHPSGKVRQ